MASIGRQLTVGLLVAVFATSAAIGGALYVGVRRTLVAEYDRALEARALSLLSAGEFDHGEFEFEFADSVMAPFERREAPEYFQIWGRGAILMRSPSLGDSQLPLMDGTGARPDVSDYVLPDGSKVRVLAIWAALRTEEEFYAEGLSQASVTIAVARSRVDLDRVLGAVSASILAMALLLPTGVAFAVWLGVRRGLRPLGKLADETASIDVDSLSHRFETTRVHDELRPICLRLNELLARLQEAMERERRFAGAAAHELRTPIAELKSLSEVAMRWPDDPSAGQESIKEAHAIACQMERLVTHLMAIARGKEGHSSVVAERVELGQAVAEAWKPFAATASERNLTVEVRTADGDCIATDRALLAAILGNLFSNAVEYAPAGSKVAVSAESDAGGARIVVENAADDLSEDDVARLFEPFWRKDAARSDSSMHSGLGLSLVALFARALGGEARVELVEGGTLRFTVDLRAAGAEVPKNPEHGARRRHSLTIGAPWPDASAAPP